MLSALLADEDTGRCICHRLQIDSLFHLQQARLLLEALDTTDLILGVHQPSTVLISEKRTWDGST